MNKRQFRRNRLIKRLELESQNLNLKPLTSRNETPAFGNAKRKMSQMAAENFVSTRTNLRKQFKKGFLLQEPFIIQRVDNEVNTSLIFTQSVSAIRQDFNHGRVYLNLRPITFPNALLKNGDQVHATEIENSLVPVTQGFYDHELDINIALVSSRKNPVFTVYRTVYE